TFEGGHAVADRLLGVRHDAGDERADMLERRPLRRGEARQVRVDARVGGHRREDMPRGSTLAIGMAGGSVTNEAATRELLVEMLKGLPGVANTDTHLVPVIRNTPREPELVRDLEAVFADPRFTGARAVVVRDHGAYIWGADVLEAKRHTEVYHFLFEATVAR